MASDKLTFPAHALVPSGGEMYCHIFENQTIGLARNLFWSITIDFEPIQYGAREFTCSMTCEWIPWPVRDWRELDGRRLDVDYGQDGVESSFYSGVHDTGTCTELVLRHRRENVFSLAMHMVVDFQGFYGGDENPEMPVQVEADVPFSGLLVVPENLFPKPCTSAELRRVASEFIDLSAYQEPEPWRTHAFIFRPAV